MSGYILESEDVYQMTTKQCRDAHNDSKWSITLGTSTLLLTTAKLGRRATVAFLHGEAFGNHTCVGAKAGEKLYLSPTRAKVAGYGKIVKIRLDMELDTEKFEIDLESSRAIFPQLGIERTVNLTSGINFTTTEGLIISDPGDIPKTNVKGIQ